MAGPDIDFKQYYPDYEYLRPIGEGGMGSVMLARNRKVGSLVAIKTLRLEGMIQQRDVFAERLKREARILFEFDSPHIIKVLDLLAPSEAPAIVMEYIEGPTLSKLLRSERPALVSSDQWPVRVSQVLVGVARALEYAHRRQVVHRDLKPSNVMIRAEDGVAKLCDFGIARGDGRGGAAGLTKSGMSMGTVHYMSPEQIHADPNLDHRSDIYSFGIILYECVTGDPPFRDKGSGSEFSVLHAHVSERPPSLDGQTGPFDPKIADLINACLEKKAEDRPQTAREVVRELLRLLPDEPEDGWPAIPPIAFTPHSASIVTEASTEFVPSPTAKDIGNVAAAGGSGTVAVPPEMLRKGITGEAAPPASQARAPGTAPQQPAQPAPPPKKSKAGLWIGIAAVLLVGGGLGAGFWAYQNGMLPIGPAPVPTPEPTQVASIPTPTPTAETPVPTATPIGVSPRPTGTPAPTPAASPTPAATAVVRPTPPSTPTPTPEPTIAPFTPQLGVALSSETIREGETATLTVTLEEPGAQGWAALAPEIELTTSAMSTASENVDYRISVPGSPVISPRRPELVFEIEALRDDEREMQESIRILVEASDGVTIGGTERGRFTVTIADGDPVTPLAASFDRDELNLAEGGSAEATLRLNREARRDERFTVRASGLPPRLDAPAELLIPEGERETTLRVALTDDGLFEDFGDGGEIVVSGAAEAVLRVRPRAAGGPPALSITAPDSVPENAGEIVFVANLIPAPASPMSARWSLSPEAGGAALFPGLSPIGAFEFARGETTAEIRVAVQDDSTYEPDGAITLTVEAPEGGTLAGASSYRVRVTDNDSPPTARVGNPQTPSASLVRIPVLLDGATAQEARIDYRIVSNKPEARLGVNYVATPPSPLVIQPGVGVGNVEINILDPLDTSDWQLSLVLSGGQGAQVNTGSPVATAAVTIRNPELEQRTTTSSMLDDFWASARSPEDRMPFDLLDMRQQLTSALDRATGRDDKLDLYLALARVEYLEGNSRDAAILLRDDEVEALWLTSPRRNEFEQYVDFYSSLDAAGRGPVRPGRGEALPPDQIFVGEIEDWPDVEDVAIRANDRIACLLDNGRDPWAIRVLRLTIGSMQAGKTPDSLDLDKSKAPNPLTVVLPPADPEPIAIDYLEDDLVVLTPNGGLAMVPADAAQPGAWTLLGAGEDVVFVDLTGTETPDQICLLADDDDAKVAVLFVIDARGGGFQVAQRIELPEDVVDGPKKVAFAGDGDYLILDDDGVAVFNDVNRQTRRLLEDSSFRGLAADRVNGAYLVDRSENVLSYPHSLIEPITTLDFDGRGDAYAIDSDEYGNLLIYGRREGRDAIMIHGRFDPAVYLSR